MSCLLDRKGLVGYFPGAVVNQSEFQTAQCGGADFIFDPCDLHKLLVLEVHRWVRLLTPETQKCEDEVELILPSVLFSSRAVCLS